MKLKRIVAGGVAVTAAVVVAGYAIIASLDVQQVADFARAQVKAATGRNLAIAGPVELKLLPTPSIQLQDLRFANADWGSRPSWRRSGVLRSRSRCCRCCSGTWVCAAWWRGRLPPCWGA